jgi:cytochrome c oxidase subunit IV
MSERVHSPLTYLIVLAGLLLLTFGTVGVSFIPLEGFWHVVCGLLIAALKAALVVLFFMHALDSSRATRIVIAAAILWTFVLFSLTFCDYFTRSLVPFMPGH